MRPLGLDDLLPLDEFAGRRPEFVAAHLRYLDRYRRVRVGPFATLIFENRQTLWFRVQEVLRVARLSEPPRVLRELDWYNRLLPRRSRLQAALLLSGPRTESGVFDAVFWRDLADGSLAFALPDTTATARLVTSRPEDRAAGAAHWVEFALSAEDRRGLSDFRRPVRLVLDYPNYSHASAALSDDVRQSLLDDLELSDRDAA